jgi:aspartyl protease family protein
MPAKRTDFMRTVATFVGLSLVAGIMVPRYSEQLQANQHRPAVMAVAATALAAPASSNTRTVVLRPGLNGHFEVEGHIDGRHMNFMVDTGASVIALTERDAATLGIHPAESEYRALVKTANGTVRAAPTQLGMVEIDDLVVRDVDAVVLPDSALSDDLLGMSFLRRLSRFEYSGGQLVLEQ